MKRAAVGLFLVVVAMGALPGIARAAVISTWPLATNANDTTDGNNGAVQNVVFDGSDATFNGINTRVTVPFVANLMPGSGLAGLETVACSETSRWLCRETAESDWRSCTHWAIDAVLEQRRARALRR